MKFSTLAPTLSSPSFALGKTAWLICLLACQLISHAAITDAVVSKNTPTLNQGRIKGSVRVMSTGDLSLGSGLTIDGSLLVPGMPELSISGGNPPPTLLYGTGSASPSCYRISLRCGVSLGSITRKVDATALPLAPAPTTGTGTRNATLNTAADRPGNFATLRTLTLNTVGGGVTLTPGRYERITLNGASTLILQPGTVANPSLYEIQQLEVNGGSRVTVSGPTRLRLKNALNLYGHLGDACHPEWLQTTISQGNLTLFCQTAFHGTAIVPAGCLTVNGNSLLHGLAFTDRLILNCGGVIDCDGGSVTPPPTNRPPVANPLAVTGNEDTATPLTLTATDPDGNPLTYQLTSQPLNGTLTGTAPNLIYTPARNFSGPDSFTFTVKDTALTSAPATVSLTVTPVNDVPIVQNLTLTTPEDTAVAVRLVATDPDDTVLSYTVTSQPLHGTLTGTAPNLTYTPTGNFNGSDRLIFTAKDAALTSAPATVTFTITPIDDAPLAQNFTVTVLEDSSVPVNLLGSDPDADPITYTVTNPPLHGTLTGTAPALIYTPAANFNGPDSFSYLVRDGRQNSNTANASLTVTPVDDLPIAQSASHTLAEDTSLDFTLAGTDLDGDALTFQIVTPPTHGTVSGNSPNLTYTPAQNFHGPDTLTFRVKSTTLTSTPATVSLSVTPVNEVPVVQNLTATTAEDTAIPLQLLATDPDDTLLSYTVTTLPQHGTLTGNAPSFTYTPSPNYHGPDTFIYTASDATLTSTPATVSLIVTPVNDVPVGQIATVSTIEDHPIPINFAGFDIDGDELFFEIVSQPNHGILQGSGRNRIYTPNHNFFGTDSFKYRIYDGFVFSATYVVSIQVVSDGIAENNSPVVTSIPRTKVYSSPDSTALTFTENGDWQTSQLVLSQTPEAGLMVRSGDIDNFGFGWPAGFDPFAGADRPVHPWPFPAEASDPSGTDRIMIGSGGNPPSRRDGYSYTTSRPNNLPLPVSLRYSPVTEAIKSAKLLIFTDDFQGPLWGSKFTATVDGQRFTELETQLNRLQQTGPIGRMVSVDLPDRLLPLLQDGSVDLLIDDATTGLGDGYVIDFVKLLINPTNRVRYFEYTLAAEDADGDPISYRVITAPTGAEWDDQLRTIRWTPTPNFRGDVIFDFEVADNRGGLTRQNFKVSVFPEDRPPVVSLQAGQNPCRTGKPLIISVSSADDFDVIELNLKVNGIPVPLDENGYGTVTLNDVGLSEAVATVVDSAGQKAKAIMKLLVAPETTELPPIADLSPVHSSTTPANGSPSTNTPPVAIRFLQPSPGAVVSGTILARTLIENPSGSSLDWFAYIIPVTAVPGTNPVNSRPDPRFIADTGNILATTQKLTASITTTNLADGAYWLVIETVSPTSGTTRAGIQVELKNSVDETRTLVPPSYVGAPPTSTLHSPDSLASLSGSIDIFASVKGGNFPVVRWSLSLAPASAAAVDAFPRGDGPFHEIAAGTDPRDHSMIATLSESDLSTGAWLLRLEVFDSQGAHSFTLRSFVYVKRTGAGPVVKAGPDQTVLGYSTARLAATMVSGQADINGVSWTAESWPESSAPVIVSPRSLTSDVRLGEPGVYTFAVRIIDSTGRIGTDRISVTATAGLTADLIWPQDGAVISGRSPLNLVGQLTGGSSSVVSVNFYLDGQSVGIASADSTRVGGWKQQLPVTADGHHYTYFAADLANGERIVSRTSTFTTFTAVDSIQQGFTLDITSPFEGDTITAPTAIIGSVYSAGLASWTLTVSPIVADGTPIPSPTVIASGSRPIRDSQLGVFDPTMLQNGAYQISLSGTTTTGEVSVYRVPVVVGGAMKLGQFSLAFQDLTIPFSGLPLTVTRTYDSRDTQMGDFGPGWNLSLNSIRVRKVGRIGEGWEQEQIFSGFQPVFSVNPTTRKKVIINFPDGRIETFEPVFRANSPISAVQPNIQGFAEMSSGTLDFKALDGSTGTLTVAGVGADLIWNGPIPGQGTIIDITFAPANPTRFRYTEPGGVSYLIDEQIGLLSISEPNGNSLNINRQGLFHSNGEAVLFTRDTTGRITKLTDPSGREIQYRYDSAGQLNSATDRVGQTARFYYENSRFPNYLTCITNPSGSDAVRTEYGDDGRLVRQIDSAGNAINFTHDISNRRESITDRLGHITTHEFDENGNITRTTAPLGGVTTRTYDANDNELTTQTPLGFTTTRAFDAKNNLLSETDPLDNVSRYTYDAEKRPLSISDALNHATAITYSAIGNLTKMVDPSGAPTNFTYSNSGNIATLTDANGTTTSYTHDAKGREKTTKVTSATGTVLFSEAYDYDLAGNRIRSIATDGSRYFTTTYQYDAENRLHTTGYPDGTYSSTYYDVNGKVSSTSDALSRTTTNTYDTRGNLIQTTSPGNRTTRSGYDVEGRMTSSTDAAGTTTYTLYDALGRATATILPDATMPAVVLTEVTAIAAAPELADNPRTLTTYDADDRVTATTDPLGSTTTFTYDAAARRTSVTDALGNTMRYYFDAAGRQTSSSDAKNQVTQFTYDNAGRLIRTDLPDGNFTLTSYDTLGRRISATDAEGNLTHFAYDPQGRLIAVTDALGAVTRYAYDQRGLQIAQTDALNRVTTYEYDTMGRRTARILPQGQREEMTYNTLGQLTAHKDFNGQTIVRSYDSTTSELLSIAAPTGHPSLALSHAPARYDFTYDLLGRRITATAKNKVSSLLSNETYSYNLRSQLTGYAGTTGSIGYGYDSAGNLAGTKSSTPGGYDVSYDYDTQNRITKVYRGQEGIDPTSTQLAAYNYDANGNLNGTGYANGVQHAYTYNPLNRLTNLNISSISQSPISNPLSLQSYAYQLNKNGHRTQITELSGRIINNTFDKLHRLTAESITTSSLITAHQSLGTLSYTYDPVGNRTSRTTIGSISQIIPNQTQAFTVNDRLTTDNYDANGNTTSSLITDHGSLGTNASDTYSFANRLIRRTTADGKTIDLTYNPDGHRLSKFITQNGLTQRLVHYLTDANNPTGYAQVIEEKDPLAASNQQLQKVNLYGHDLISSLLTDHSALITQLYYTYDGLGSVRSLTNETGDLQETYDYDAYGTLIGLAKQNPTTSVLESTLITDHSALITQSEFLYNGEQWDADLGMYFLRARYLNTNTGRFHTQDTHEGRNGEPQTLHKYLYANGNPSFYVDPSGNYSLGESTLVQGQLISNVSITFQSAQVSLGIGQRILATAIVSLGGSNFISEAVRSVARSTLKKKIEDTTKGRKIVFHYTDKPSADLIGATGVMVATSKYKGYSGVFPSGAYASNTPPWSIDYTQRELSARFYGGNTGRDVSWFVALDGDQFTNLFYLGYSDFEYKPGKAGQDVSVKPLTSGPNLMMKW